MKTIRVVFPLICFLSACVCAADKPNILVILSDDYGWGSATCYGANPELVRTPNLDRLAREGRRFTDANTTSSVCSPTRYSMLTGRYCWRTSLKHEVLGTASPLHIEPARFNLASLLKKHGYHTAAIGKWHLGYGTDPRVDFTRELKPGPLEIGFDYHFGLPSNHGDNSGVYVENHRVYGLRSDKLVPREKALKNFKGVPFMGLDAPHRVDEEVMPFLTAKVVEWLDKQSADQPFFLYYTPVAIHNPVTPSPKTKGSSKAGSYGDWIHELDASVGRVLEVLDRKGLAKNTLILFTSDNGGVNKPTVKGEATDALQAGLKISGPYRGGKHDVWEGGFHVPYLVRWPGRVPAGTVCNEMLSLADTLATVAALVGEPLPSYEVGAEDSYNMLPAWLGQNYASPIRPDLIVHSADGNFAIRRGNWKYIEGDYHPDTLPGAIKLRNDQFHPQLYDLLKDGGETQDVIAANPVIARELEELLNRYRAAAYSRKLPPPPPPKPIKISALPAISGQVIKQEDFAQMPGNPWVLVRGKWEAKAGILKGTQEAGDRVGAALRAPLGLNDFDIQYQISLPEGASHTLRLQGRQKDYVFLVNISARRIAILRQAADNEPTGNKIMVEEKFDLKPGEFVPVRVTLQGEQMTVQIGETVVQTAHPSFSGNKSAFALMAMGKGIAFSKLIIRKSSP